ncbi:MAG: hypothetical protein ABI472_07910 [Ginsengibacter sp.]
MKILLFSMGILYGLTSGAQKYYDYQDTRKKNETFIRLPKTEIRADLASFTLSGIDEAVGKADLQKIPFTDFGPGNMNFGGGNIKASVTLSSFDKSKHKLDYDEKYLTRIDRKTYYGDYGSLPKTDISNVTLVIDNDTIAIPPAAYADLHNLNLTYMDKGALKSRNGIYESKDGHRVYLYLFCKNTTGSYEVTFIIQDKKYFRRVLDYDFM